MCFGPFLTIDTDREVCPVARMPGIETRSKAKSMSESVSVNREPGGASVWRVLPDPFESPAMAALRSRAETCGRTLTAIVSPERGGYRHTLMVNRTLGE
jgi:hypothetical protein